MLPDTCGHLPDFVPIYSILTTCDGVVLRQRYGGQGLAANFMCDVLNDLRFCPYTNAEENKFTGLDKVTEARIRCVCREASFVS